MEVAKKVKKPQTPQTAQEAAEAQKRKEAREKDKRRRFLEVAPKRVRVALKALTNVSRCGNKAGYSYTPEESAKIIAALKNSYQSAVDAFSDNGQTTQTFTL